MFGDFKTSKISEIEEKILKYWQEKKIFEKSVSRKAKRDYVFYDGPPFATGLPHYGHVLSGTIKDVIPRYQTMKGRRVERLWGWDCHGLPIENLVEQNLGLKTKQDIEKYGIDKFNKAAHENVLEYEDDWKKIISRIGRWVDMEKAYKTMDSNYTESVWWVFKNLFQKKLIYEGYKSMHICPRCETTLSNFEVALGYKDIEDSSIIVKFELEGLKNTYVLAWTTTPWTLPGNVALAVNPNAEYLIIKLGAKEIGSRYTEDISGGKSQYLEITPGRYIFAKDRSIDHEISQLFDPTDYDKYLKGQIKIEQIKNVERVVKGKELIGKKYEPLFDYYAKDKKLENRANGWKIYPASFVKTDEGTGIVHIAPAFGEEDMNLGKKNHLPFIQHVFMDGRFKKEVADFAGLAVKPKENYQSTDKKIIEWLAQRNKLFKAETIIHSYPHCWRCDTPLLNYATSSWFVNVSKIKKGKGGLLDNNQKINWVPAHIKEGRFGKGLLEAPDWAISRSRYWGAPLPVWQCQKSGIHADKNADLRGNKNGCGKQIVIGSIEELKARTEKSGNHYFLMRHGEALNNLKRILNSILKDSDKYPLTLEGRAGVEKSVKKLVRQLKNKKIDLIFSSDFMRAKETAELAAGLLEIPKRKIIFDKRLREINWGVLAGKNPREAEKLFPWLEERFRARPDKGESLTDVKIRVGNFIYEIDRKYSGKNILIVSHEDPIWCLFSAANGLGVKAAVKMKSWDKDFIKTGEIMKLEFSPLPHNPDYELDLHRPYIDEVELVCDCGGGMARVDYVFDCWFESGAMPYGQSHYPFENKKKFEKNFPAEFIAEGLDQTRGWFYTLLVLSTGLFKKPAYKNVVVNGIILAENGEKMSKRLKNYPDPMEIIRKYGADALRYYLLSSPVVRAEALNFSEKGVDEIYKKVILRLINVFNFYEMYATKKPADAKFKASSKNVLDRWILLRLKQLISEVDASMAAYELDRAARAIADFIDDLSTWYIRRSRERFRWASSNHSQIKSNKSRIDTGSAVFITKFVLLELAKVIAPFTPFLAEGLYLRLSNKLESVHLESWSKAGAKVKRQELELIEDMKTVRRLASAALEARAKVGIKVRQPLRELRIQSDKLKDKTELLEILKDEVNVKTVIFHKGIRSEVELDTRITPQLKEEGALREFARLVQGLRQEAGYTPKDKIYLWMEVPEEIPSIILKNREEFKARVGAKNIEFKRVKKIDAEIETTHDSQKIWLGIKKV